MAWLTLSALFAVAVLIGAFHGFGAVVAAWLPIPADRYYFWMAPMTPLICLFNFLIFAGVIQLMAAGAGRSGSFNDTLTVVALAFCFPVFATMRIFEGPVMMVSSRADLPGGWCLPVWFDNVRQFVGVIFGGPCVSAIPLDA